LSGTPSHSPASILGVLCRKWYPGIVELTLGGREPAFSWDRYALASDDHYCNKQDRVLAEFWVSLSHTTLVNTSHSSLFFQILTGYIVFVYAEVFQA
jgi:hypothetical protein